MFSAPFRPNWNVCARRLFNLKEHREHKGRRFFVLLAFFEVMFHLPPFGPPPASRVCGIASAQPGVRSCLASPQALGRHPLRGQTTKNACPDGDVFRSVPFRPNRNVCARRLFNLKGRREHKGRRLFVLFAFFEVMFHLPPFGPSPASRVCGIASAQPGVRSCLASPQALGRHPLRGQTTKNVCPRWRRFPLRSVPPKPERVCEETF